MSIKTWNKRISTYYDGVPIPKSLINALTAVFRDTRGRFPKEVHERLATVARYPMLPAWSITPEQTTQGLEWLRLSKIWRTLSRGDKAIVEDFHRFTFQGVFTEDQTRHPSFPRVSARPVYRVHAKSGAWFDYASAPWQSGAYGVGGHPSFKVMSRGKK